jgi:glucuronosyltransferase
MDMEEKMKDMNVFDMKENDKSLSPLIMLEAFTEGCSLTYDLPQVKEIMNQKFDLILLQPFFNDCALGLIWKLQAPLVLFFPSVVPSFLVSKIGGHFPPSFNPNFALGYPFQKVMTFYQRFLNFGVTILMDLIIDFYYEPKMTAIYREKLGNDVPTVSEILANTSLILSNSHFSLNGHKPYLPDVIDVGGIHNHPSQPLPKVI